MGSGSLGRVRSSVGGDGLGRERELVRAVSGEDDVVDEPVSGLREVGKGRERSARWEGSKRRAKRNKSRRAKEGDRPPPCG